jgi:endonuclease/exonuclease/phosphatase family metal-dependent hydrolase
MRKMLLPFLAISIAACVSKPIAAVTSAIPSVDPSGASAGPPLRVMTFNIRYNNPGDGINAWPNRKAWVAKLIRFHDADVVGVQEALHGMLVDLDTLLPEYSRVGVGRTDGKNAGEFSAILYKRSRVEMLENQTFWLSTNPEAVGVKAWDAALERVATWGRFRDLASGCTYLHLNTSIMSASRHVRKVQSSFAVGLVRLPARCR